MCEFYRRTSLCPDVSCITSSFLLQSPDTYNHQTLTAKTLFKCPFEKLLIENTKQCSMSSRPKLMSWTSRKYFVWPTESHCISTPMGDRYNNGCCVPYRNDTIAPARKSQHLLEENFSRATHRREEYDRASDVFRPGIIQWPDFAIIIVYNNLKATHMPKSHCWITRQSHGTNYD